MIRNALGRLSWTFAAIFDRSDFSLLYQPHQPIRFRGRIPRARVPGIAAFLSDDLQWRSPVVVRGTKTRGVWRFSFSSNLPKPEAQRLRNFLTEHLS